MGRSSRLRKSIKERDRERSNSIPIISKEKKEDTSTCLFCGVEYSSLHVCNNMFNNINQI